MDSDFQGMSEIYEIWNVSTNYVYWNWTQILILSKI